MTPADGYTTLPARVGTLVCHRCGAVVGYTTVHDQWHQHVDTRLGLGRALNGDEWTDGTPTE